MYSEFDIAIIGGGPVGATAAALLARHGGFAPERIALLAPELAGRSAAGPTGFAGRRDLALQSAGAAQCARLAAPERGAPVRLRVHAVWHESVPCDGPEVLIFRAAELAEAELGHIVENRALAAASLAAFRDRVGP